MFPLKIRADKVLISINYESSKGGISRVARLMAEAISFDFVMSLYGSKSENGVKYYGQKSVRFMRDFLLMIFINRPSLLVFDHVGPASLLAFIPNILLKYKKIVVFLHDEEAWKKVSKRHSWGLKKASHILCNSNYTYQKFISCNPEFKYKTKVCLLAGVPSSFLTGNLLQQTNRHHAWIDSKNPYCIFVSRLWIEHRYKGYFELLEAFALLYKNNTHAKLRLALIGNGDDVDNIKKYIEENHLEQIVEVFTGITDNELTTFYKQSSALVFPSIREGFGFVFLEAMFFKKACIGVKNQPAEEIIVPGKTGLLLEDNSPVSILRALQDLELFPEKYKNFGVAGEKLFQENFRNDHFIQRFLSAIGDQKS